MLLNTSISLAYSNPWWTMMIGVRRDSGLMRKDGGDGGKPLRRSRIAAAIFVGIFIGCVFAFFYPNGFFGSSPSIHQHVTNSDSEVLFAHLFIITLLFSYLFWTFTQALTIKIRDWLWTFGALCKSEWNVTRSWC